MKLLIIQSRGAVVIIPTLYSGLATGYPDLFVVIFLSPPG